MYRNEQSLSEVFSLVQLESKIQTEEKNGRSTTENCHFGAENGKLLKV